MVGRCYFRRVENECDCKDWSCSVLPKLGAEQVTHAKGGSAHCSTHSMLIMTCLSSTLSTLNAPYSTCIMNYKFQQRLLDSRRKPQCLDIGAFSARHRLHSDHTRRAYGPNIVSPNIEYEFRIHLLILLIPIQTARGDEAPFIFQNSHTGFPCQLTLYTSVALSSPLNRPETLVCDHLHPPMFS